THTSVEVTCDDMPFLVDSLGMVLTQAGLTIHLMVHPIIAVRRDRSGQLIELAEDGERSDQFVSESWQHIEIDRIGDPQRLRDLEQKIQRTLEDVRLAVTDWKAMRQRALDIAQDIETTPPPTPVGEAREVATLLRWMEDKNFTFLGYREYKLQR